jgi:hypothetical protein
VLRVKTLTLREIETAMRDAWSAETCDPVDQPWSPHNPARGQCGVTALVLHDLLGGELLSAEVRYADGSRQGMHLWNRLPGGFDVDLTRDQFGDHEKVGLPQVLERPDGPPVRCAEQYELLKSRVYDALGLAVAVG